MAKPKHKRFKAFPVIFMAVSILLFIAGGLVGYYLGYDHGFEKKINSPIEKQSETFSKSNLDKEHWNTYTNAVGKFSIQYPPTWKIQEHHALSNREVDDPTEINTTVLKGHEGEIVLQWGPMGFGGGCGEEYSRNLQLKDISVKTCAGIRNGKYFWSQIYHNQNVAFGARASSTDEKTDVIEAIFSTLSFF